jgi:Mce-associated membrane protein
MPPRELPAETLDAGSGVENLSAAASASPANEDDLAQAEARAEAARARALQLRQLADATEADGDGDGDITIAATAAAPAEPRRRLRRPGRKALAVLAAMGCVCASLAASGYLLEQHREVLQQRQRTAEFAAEARNSILLMLTINASTARADVQRFVDETTGEFKAGILLSAEDFVKAVEQSNANSKGSVQAVAVQSMTDNSAIVLVAAKSELTKPDAAKPESKNIRIVVDVRRDGGQLKVSRVEFVQ